MKSTCKNVALFAAGAVATGVLFAGIAMSEGGFPPHGLGDGDTGARGAAEAVWFTVGSTGTVDESDLDIYNAKAGTMTILNSAPTRSTLNVRYNITAVEELVGPADVAWQMGVRFRDNGPDARVLVKLREYRIVNGALSTLLVFDSNDFAPATGWQAQIVNIPANSFDFDWNNAAYYLEVIIQRTGSGGRPGLGMVGIAEQ